MRLYYVIVMVLAIVLGSTGSAFSSDINEKEAISHATKALQYMINEDYKSAVVEYKKAITLFPTVCYHYENLGICYLRMNKYQKAIEQFRIALRHTADPKERANIQKLLQKAERKHHEDPRKVLVLRLPVGKDREYAKRSATYKDKNLEKAIEELEKAIILNPYSSIYRFNLAFLYSAHKQHQKAIAQYKIALLLSDSDSKFALYTEKNLQEEKKRFQQSKQKAKKRLYEDVEKTTLLDLPQYDKAEKHYKLGLSYLDINSERAIDEFEQALIYNPYDPDTREKLADSYLKIGKYGDAMSQYIIIRNSQPTWVKKMDKKIEKTRKFLKKQTK